MKRSRILALVGIAFFITCTVTVTVSWAKSTTGNSVLALVQDPVVLGNNALWRFQPDNLTIPPQILTLGAFALGVEMDPTNPSLAYVVDAPFGPATTTGVYPSFTLSYVAVPTMTVIGTFTLAPFASPAGGAIIDVEITPDGRLLLMTLFEFGGTPATPLIAMSLVIFDTVTGLSTVVPLSNVGVGATGRIAISPDSTKAIVDHGNQPVGGIPGQVVSIVGLPAGTILATLPFPRNVIPFAHQATNQKAFVLWADATTGGTGIRRILLSGTFPFVDATFPTSLALNARLDANYGSLVIDGNVFGIVNTATDTLQCGNVHPQPLLGTYLSSQVRGPRAFRLNSVVTATGPTLTFEAVNTATCALITSTPLTGQQPYGTEAIIANGNRSHYVFGTAVAGVGAFTAFLNFADINALGTPPIPIPIGTGASPPQVIDLDTDFRPEDRTY